ncbi:EscU/YscU/HrcU family type III secretion system export apparatus switch protein [Egicoccus halophilus]|uniref:Flagellar biosynthesis protein FlhB n=1 Tax=Egicoccus halophilus TaxID=1670830 RepID=A0A8J3EUA0_9ACTN|nr:EscU/YscU/HrcU family type III secretion system export apparatus switch protein [Egicoccus halophilus]GGI06729.1 flagellar biosynthesis protein FlhB [Egicoccus halophilus]
MAKDGKTERATPQRRKKARDEGTVARSQEVAVAASFAGLIGILATVGSSILYTSAGHFAEVFRTAGSADALTDAGPRALQMMIVMAGPFLAIAVVVGVLASVSQVGFKVNMKLAKPKLKNLSLKKGLEKFKPAVASWELLRSMLKLGAVGAVVWPTLAKWPEHLLSDRALGGGLQRISSALGSIILRAALLALLIAGADYAFQRWRTNSQMKMSHHEIKREHKDSEGDPLVRAQRRRRASDLSRNRMMQDVATADVLVTNPTHLCVALRYDPDEGAPRVVAKGADLVADKLKSIARRHGVPITPDIPLARALFQGCKVGQHVPAALYEAVAVVLATAYRRSGRGPASRKLQKVGA